MKRLLQDAQVAAPEAVNKRLKRLPDRFSGLSNELILRVLDHLDVPTIVVCAQLSKKFKSLTEDSQLWKAQYHERFVAPRLRFASSRRAKAARAAARRLAPTSRGLPWLDEEKLVKAGNTTDWKRQYKLRTNWSTGSCHLAEISLAAPPILSLLARLHPGVIVTADRDEGLRAWSYKDQKRLLATHRFSNHHLTDGTCPVSLAIDSDDIEHKSPSIAVGFEDGSFGIYAFDSSSDGFAEIYFHPPSNRGALTGIAISSNYLLTMSDAQTLSLYRLSQGGDDAPLLLTSLKSHSVRPPLSLSLRRRPDKIIASIAYASPSMTAGWSTGIQEIHVSLDGQVLDSRVAVSNRAQNSAHTMRFLGEPTCLSYSHPYLLVAHADNTLTFYLVTSSDEGLSMSSGKRLWGHTSSVFGAHVGGRGKAVSVSSKGDEIRVWELEGATTGAESEAFSIRVRPDSPENTMDHGRGLGFALRQMKQPESETKCWVGFDEENVVVVREQDGASQALAVYDFT